MRYAIIDLGTNTFNLLICEVLNGQNIRLFDTKRPVKLGEGGINNKIIVPAAFKRGVDALHEYAHIIKEHQCKNVKAIATSAIRNASNGNEFVAAVKLETGIDILVIDGNKEAELIYHGVKQALDLGAEPMLIMDIGGGSTEFIIANNQNILWKQSFELGAARLLDRFKPSEPITLEQINAIESYLNEQLVPLKQEFQKYSINTLVGSSGSFDSLAEVIINRYRNMEWPKDLTTFNFEFNELTEIIQTMLNSTREERLKIKGLSHMRVDMIVVSSVLVKWVCNYFKLEDLRLSTYSLKEGALYLIQKGEL